MAHLLFSVKQGKHVGVNPLLQNHSEQERQRRGPPSASEAWGAWTTCGIKLVNRDTMSFSDPNLEDCVELSRHLFRAGVWRKPDSVEYVERMRSFRVDPKRTPWQPRPEYVALLDRQGRLQRSEDAADGNSNNGADSAAQSRALLEAALKAGDDRRS
jgi:hypothetical protein